MARLSCTALFALSLAACSAKGTAPTPAPAGVETTGYCPGAFAFTDP